jgi:hypothetical protein
MNRRMMMIKGIGTPSSQRRIPRPIIYLLPDTLANALIERCRKYGGQLGHKPVIAGFVPVGAKNLSL